VPNPESRAAPDIDLELARTVDPSAGDDRLANRLAWITGLRLGFLTLLLVSTAFFYLRGALGVYPQSQSIVFSTIGAAYALAAIYATVLRSGRQLQRLAEAQIVLDQLTWTAIVYVSGGATSGATSFYGLTCLVGAILIGLRGAAIAAVSGITIFAVLCAGFASRTILPPRDQGAANYVVDWDGMVYPFAVNALGIVVVALLAGYLAERLRRTGGALAEANERALAAERLALLGRVAAGLAHEIRNPLGSISGSIEMLREAPGLSDEDRRLCDIVQREAARLNHLVSDMMDLSGPRKPVPDDVDVAALAREVVELASRSDRSGSGDVTVEYRGPEGALRARCDPAQMRQVLWNLVRNGVQATGAGTTVTVSVSAVAERVEMAVTDEGPGITKEAAFKIFDAFYTTRAGGAGIGLAVVRRIIEDHKRLGATLEVRGADQPGATFVVGLARTEGTARKSELDRDRGVVVPANAGSRS
jgi:two-component system sensor histidine kinase HydH